MLLTFVVAAVLAVSTQAVPSPSPTAKRAACTVDSPEAAFDLSDCATVEITSFTVPNDTTITMSLAEGATITMTGEVTFASTVASGPLLTFQGTNVNFNGNGMMFDGNGADYWDGLGTNGGKAKPHPFIQIEASGTFQDFVAYNTPAQAIRVQPAANIGPLTITGVYVNNAAGDVGELGHNTDGFDVRGTDITIENCMVQNQDDCIAINDGQNILFQNNVCSGGHGMSIGSIATGDFVSGVVFSHNTVSNSMYGTRIKAQSAATTGAVTNVTWTGNTISGATKYGVLITQSYPDDDGTPG
ncbi:hypothetical protein FOMPIDRAFT_281608, partial [Fomitopsis schrenkii]